MVDPIKEQKLRKFAALGVKEEDIFREIVRARHLDYVLFSTPEASMNREYGLTQEDLYAQAQRLTGETLGEVPGDAERYALIYTEALSVDPMLFSGAAPAGPLISAWVHQVLGRAETLGQSVLFAGAEQYLSCLTDIFVALRERSVSVALGDASWQKSLAMIYARGHVMTLEEAGAGADQYDYIFYVGTDSGASAACWQTLQGRLKAAGRMEAFLPDSLLRSDEEAVRPILRSMAERGVVSALYHAVDGEVETDLIVSGPADRTGRIVFGDMEAENGLHTSTRAALQRDAFAAADSWDYDLYAWNSHEAVQALLAAGLLDPDFAVGSVFREVQALKGTLGTYPVIRPEAVTDSCIRKDLVEEEIAADVKRAAAGDLAAVRTAEGLRCAVVPRELDGAAAVDVMLLRPLEGYTAEYLKGYLDGPIGQLFMSTMTAGGACQICASRLLRVPLRRAQAETIGAVTALVRQSTAALASAEAEWRRVKRDFVGLTMGGQR